MSGNCGHLPKYHSRELCKFVGVGKKFCIIMLVVGQRCKWREEAFTLEMGERVKLNGKDCV